MKIYSKIVNFLFKDWNWLAFFLGMFIIEMGWFIQPEWSQGLMMIRSGSNLPFLMMGWLLVAPIGGIILYRLYKIFNEAKRRKK